MPGEKTGNYTKKLDHCAPRSLLSINVLQQLGELIPSMLPLDTAKSRYIFCVLSKLPAVSGSEPQKVSAAFIRDQSVSLKWESRNWIVSKLLSSHYVTCATTCRDRNLERSCCVDSLCIPICIHVTVPYTQRQWKEKEEGTLACPQNGSKHKRGRTQKCGRDLNLMHPVFD